MGLGPPVIGLFHLLRDRGLLGEKETVVDFGSQEYDSKFATYDEAYRSFVRDTGGTLPEATDPATGRLKGPSANFFRVMGWDYTSFDIDGRFGAEVVDFNCDTIAERHREKYSVTMNLGTSEHVFNQLQFFKLQHQVTKPGGLMIHTLPLQDYVNHGLFSYSPTFFYSLAKYNQYDVLGMWKTGKENLHQFLPAVEPFEERRMFLFCVLKKRISAEFNIPLQVNEPMLLSQEAELRYSAHVQLDLGELSKAQTLPREFWFDVNNCRISIVPIDVKLTKHQQRIAKLESLKLDLAKTRAAATAEAILPKKQRRLLSLFR